MNFAPDAVPAILASPAQHRHPAHNDRARLFWSHYGVKMLSYCLPPRSEMPDYLRLISLGGNLLKDFYMGHIVFVIWQPRDVHPLTVSEQDRQHNEDWRLWIIKQADQFLTANRFHRWNSFSKNFRPVPNGLSSPRNSRWTSRNYRPGDHSTVGTLWVGGALHIYELGSDIVGSILARCEMIWMLAGPSSRNWPRYPFPAWDLCSHIKTRVSVQVLLHEPTEQALFS